jgi:hypothetical protein
MEFNFGLFSDDFSSRLPHSGMFFVLFKPISYANFHPINIKRVSIYHDIKVIKNVYLSPKGCAMNT